MLRRSGIFLLAFALVALASVVLAQTPAARTPDLTGVWTTYRAPAGQTQGRGGGGARGAQPELPLRPEAKAKVQEYQRLIAGTGDTPGGYCLGTGMPGSMMGSGGYPMEIIQRPDQITIVYEAHNEIRRVYFGNRIIPEKDRLSERNGYSTGRWEGNTLVVDVIHLSDRTWLDRAGNFHSEALHVVERYTPTSPDHILYEATIEDPMVYARPWKMSMTLYRRQGRNSDLLELEYDCYPDLLEQEWDKPGSALFENP